MHFHLETKFCVPVFAFIVLLEIQMAFSNKDHQPIKMFEGDIIVSKSEFNKIENDVKNTGGTKIRGMWTGGIIPYVISTEFDKKQEDEISKAMDEISGDTCIQFEPRSLQHDYLFIRLGSKCSSKVGKIGGKQELLMNPLTCMRHGTIVHELLHTLGFWHEQSRTDRDKYITINWDNIKPKSELNFERYENPFSRNYDLPYDYSSIMHYSGYAFQKNQGLKTIIPKIKNSPMGLRNSMSYFDKLKINLMYKCRNLDKK